MHAISQALLAFCRWCDASFFGEDIRNSVWLFPFVEIFHLLALGLLGGTIILVNLSLLGVRFRGEPVSRLARDVQPLFNASLAVMLISGFLLFSTEALKMYGSPAFSSRCRASRSRSSSPTRCTSASLAATVLTAPDGASSPQSPPSRSGPASHSAAVPSAT